MNDELKGKLGLNDLQLLFVPSFNNTTDNFYERMDINVNDSRMGMYILYANMKGGNSADEERWDRYMFRNSESWRKLIVK